jgi:hypothetical protein
MYTSCWVAIAKAAKQREPLLGNSSLGTQQCGSCHYAFCARNNGTIGSSMFCAACAETIQRGAAKITGVVRVDESWLVSRELLWLRHGDILEGRRK